MKLTESQKAYIAGILDGDGCIGATKKPGKPTLHCSIQVTQTDARLIEWLAAALPGGVVLRNRHTTSQSGRAKPHHSIFWQKASVVQDILGMVRPYLVLKQAQADLVLSTLRCRDLLREREGNPVKLKRPTTEHLLFEESVYSKMKTLNQRGV